ncbi:pentapeptide repeat-containing protein [Streptomyces sp. NPDC006539]
MRLQQLWFTRCTFRRAIPSGASLRGVYRAGCDLTGADLRGRS